MLTLEQAQRYAEEVVAERGEDFVYNPKDGTYRMCAYVSQEDERYPQYSNQAIGSAVTGCLVGEILKRAGLLTDYIAGCSTSIGSLITDTNKVVVENEETRQFLSTLQIEQDLGASWGIALKTAKEEVTTANHNSL